MSMINKEIADFRTYAFHNQDFTQKIKSDTVSTVSPSISHDVMGPDAMVFVF